MTLESRPRFVALDVETTLNGNEDIGLAHPMHPDNKVVLYGVCFDRCFDRYQTLVSDSPKVFWRECREFFEDGATWCGHNFSFDLLYCYKDYGVKQALQRCKIWDTQIAEYILSGQRSKFSSLDELSIKYGLPVKDDKIKGYFQAGLGSDKIPRVELQPYLEQDVTNTRAIAIAQWEEASKNGQLALILSQMEALHATTEMMWNGLHIDKPALDAYTVEVVNEYVEVKLTLEERAFGRVEDINSPKQWSQFFFGGKKKTKVKEEVGLFKNGNTKYRLVDKVITIPAFIKYIPDPDKISAKTGQISVDDSVLSDMLNHTHDATAISIIKALLKYRELSKQLSTYVQGLSKHIINDYIYGRLNQTATVTGRLSSTNPNLQNISNNPIKQIFTSRFEDGVIVEVDFNQLEIAALAHVTKDKQLIADISFGTDIHSALYKSMFGRLPTKEERKPFKSRSFQLIYGAGAKAIAKQAGCTLDEAKKFVEVFYNRYPQVKEWHDTFAVRVDRLSILLKDKDGLTEKVRTYEQMTETGRKFIYKEYYSDSSWSARMYNFSPTELKNWSVQGLATGDIVPMMLGKLFRKFGNRDDVKMVNTIHDSIMFDVRAMSAADFILEVTDTLKETHKHFLEVFKKPLALKLNASASYGINWFKMEEVTE
jgi:DNA polymerase I-like protein with 3'-5' exonuclease and polymerase domains